ncbi:MAG: hypothetical protein ABSC53_09765 [Bacteroidota bacterium]
MNKQQEICIKALRAVVQLKTIEDIYFGNVVTKLQLIADWLLTGKPLMIETAKESVRSKRH